MNEILPKVQKLIDTLLNDVDIDRLDQIMEDCEISSEDLELFMNSK